MQVNAVNHEGFVKDEESTTAYKGKAVTPGAQAPLMCT
jgi:hypothetical protein